MGVDVLSDECCGDKEADDHADGAGHGGVAQGQYTLVDSSRFLHIGQIVCIHIAVSSLTSVISVI